MAKIIETIVYPLAELSDAAKDKAREWYREGALHDDWDTFIFEDFERICAILGVKLDQRRVRLYGGGERQKSCIFYSGFWSQGDGACFEGEYVFEPKASTEIRKHAPQDQELHRISSALRIIQKRNANQLRARIKHSGFYYHEHSMNISVKRESPTGRPASDGAEEIVAKALRDLARWLYRQLTSQCEYLMSDEIVDESILVNAYTFTETGRRFG